MAGTISPYADNAFGVRTRDINFDAPGSPTTMTYHGISLVVNGKAIGRIQSWTPQMYQRDGELVYELSKYTFGRPVDYVPSKNTGYTIEGSRTEIWDQETERVFGYPAPFTDLIDQDRPFTVSEYLFRGPQVYRTWSYMGCWFGAKNVDSVTAEGNAKYMSNFTINFVSRIRTV